MITVKILARSKTKEKEAVVEQAGEIIRMMVELGVTPAAQETKTMALLNLIDLVDMVVEIEEEVVEEVEAAVAASNADKVVTLLVNVQMKEAAATSEAKPKALDVVEVMIDQKPASTAMVRDICQENARSQENQEVVMVMIDQKKCFNCQGEGHMSRECTEPKKERFGGDRGPKICYNCQGEGHFANDCTEPRKPRNRDNDDGGGGGGGGYKRRRNDDGGSFRKNDIDTSWNVEKQETYGGDGGGWGNQASNT